MAILVIAAVSASDLDMVESQQARAFFYPGVSSSRYAKKLSSSTGTTGGTGHIAPGSALRRYVQRPRSPAMAPGTGLRSKAVAGRYNYEDEDGLKC